MNKLLFISIATMVGLVNVNAQARECTKKICTDVQNLQSIPEDTEMDNLENNVVCKDVRIKGKEWIQYHKCGFNNNGSQRFGLYIIISRKCQEWEGNIVVNTYSDEIKKWTGECSD